MYIHLNMHIKLHVGLSMEATEPIELDKDAFSGLKELEARKQADDTFKDAPPGMPGSQEHEAGCGD